MTEKETRVCHICGSTVARQANCKTCMRNFRKLPDVDIMTGDQRADEMLMWGGVLEIPFRMMHGRLEQLIGRPIQTIEFAWFQGLVNECRFGKLELEQSAGVGYRVTKPQER